MSGGPIKTLLGFPVIFAGSDGTTSQRNRRRLAVKAQRKLDEAVRRDRHRLGYVPVEIVENMDDKQPVVLWGTAVEGRAE